MDCIDSRHYSGFLVNNFLSTNLLSQQTVIDRPSGNSYNKIDSIVMEKEKIMLEDYYKLDKRY